MEQQQQWEQQEEQQQRHDRRRVHHSILYAVRRVEQQAQQQARQQQQQQRHRLTMRVEAAFAVDCHSVRHLVDFLRGDSHEVTELKLLDFRLSHAPSDGGLDVLREFFANDAKLTKVGLIGCNFGSAADTSRLLSAFNNMFLTDCTLTRIRNLEGAALGACLSSLLQQNGHSLLRLECSVASLSGPGIRALQPGLRSINRHLKELALRSCQMGDEDLSLLVDALIGNTTLEILDISWNSITPACLDNVARLVEFTRLKEIKLRCDYDPDFMRNEFEAGMQRFNSILQNKNTSLEKISGFGFDHLAAINIILARNRGMNYAEALLALQPPRTTGTPMPIPSKSGTWYKAFGKLAGRYSRYHVNVYPGTSAIFKILQARPALLEKQLQRPPTGTAPAASRETRQSTSHRTDQDILTDTNHNDDDMKPAAAPTNSSGPKRRNLE